MKTTSLLLPIIAVLQFFSCSSDDDSNSQVKGYFPTEIAATGFSNPIDNLIIDIDYNSDNTISRMTFTDGFNIKTKTYSYTNGRVTQVENEGYLGGPDVRSFIYDASGLLTSIIDETDSGSETFPIAYNSETNTYTITDGDTYSIVLDSSDNPYRYSSSFFTDLSITLDASNSGVFKNVAPQVALQFDLVLFNSGHILYFLNQKQINHYEFGIQDFEVINSRDAQDNITTVGYHFDSETIQLSISYQERNL
jgi:hypothetical protein